jgi:hypothetical protein
VRDKLWASIPIGSFAMRAYLGLSARALVVVGALLSATAPPARAQADAAAIAALEDRIRVLEDRIDELEDKFVDVKGEGLKVKTPFSVVNESGGPIFQVIGTGGQSTFVFIGGDGAGTGGSKILLEAGTGASPGGRITLTGGGGGPPVFQAGEIGGKATAIVGDKDGSNVLIQTDGSAVEVTASQTDDRAVSMKVDGEAVALKTVSNGNAVMVGDDGRAIGMMLEIGGTFMAELSKWNDRQVPSLRINGTGGTQVAGVGADPANPANGSINVVGGSAEVWMNGEGWVKLLANNQERIKLDATKQSIAMTGGTPETILISAEKQSITVKGKGSQQMVTDGEKGFVVQSGENKVASLGLKSGGGNSGQLFIFSGSGTPVFQATSEGGGAEVIVGDESIPHIKMDTQGGQAQIAAEGGGDNVIALIASQGLASLRADTDGFAVSLGKLDGQVGMTIEQGNKLMGEFSKPNDRNSASLRVYGSGGQIVAGLGAQSGEPDSGLVVANGTGDNSSMMTGEGWLGLKEAGNLKVVASAADKVIALYGEGSEYILTLSPGKSGGGNITTFDTGGTGVFSAGATPDGGTACVVHKGKITCLGIGLPLMGGGSN